MSKGVGFGERVRILRALHGLSAKDFADAIGVTSSGLYAWESGKNAITLERATKVAEVFGVPLEMLVGCESWWNDLLRDAGVKRETI